jgi:tetratricopeptide (TPR) repeat protein
MRRINVKLLAYSLVFLVLLVGGTVLAHYLQSERIARALLQQAERAKSEEEVARKRGDVMVAKGHADEEVRFLTRYLEFAPEDTDQRARLGRLLSINFLARSMGQRQRTLFVLEQVLARDPDRHAERCLLVQLMLDTRRYDLVKGHLEDYLQKALPDNAEVERLTGRWNEGRGKYLEAAEWYRKSVSHDPSHVETYVRLANVLRLDSKSQPGLAKEAGQWMDELVKQNEGDFHAHLARWNYQRVFGNLSEPKKLEEAGRDVTRALEIAPDEADTLLAAAELEKHRHNLDTARSHLETGVKLHSQDARLYQALALLELAASRREQAIATLQNAARVINGANRFNILWDLANLLIDGKDTKQASKTIEDVRQSQPTPGAVDYLQARLHMAEGSWAEAARTFEQVRPLLEVSPELVTQVDLQLGRCYENLNEPAAQLTAYGRVIARISELRNEEEKQQIEKTARAGMATAQTALGHGDDALDQYRQLMKIPGAPSRGWIELARLSIGRIEQTGKGDWKEVEQSIALAEKANPEAVEIPLLRAESLVVQKKLKSAYDLLVEARDRRPKQIELWTALAALAERQGKADEVIHILNEAEKQVGDQVELRLFWVRWRTDHPDIKDPSWSKLSVGLDKFKSEDQVRLLRGLASAQYRLGDLTEARRLWTLLTQQPSCDHDLELRLVLFQLALEAKDESAMTRLQKDMQRIEGNNGPVSRLCQATRLIQEAKEGKDEFLKKESLEKAQSLLEAAAAQRPTWPALPLARAEIEELQGNRDWPIKAIYHYRRAVELGERNPRVLHRLVDLLVEQRRPEEADQEIKKIQQQGPLSENMQRLAVAVSLQNRDSTRATDLALQSIQKSTDYRDYLWLGQVLEEAGRPTQEVEKYFRRAVELAPQAPETWLALVKYLASAKKQAEAENAIEQVRRQLHEKDRSLALAQCYEVIGRLGQAEAEYQHAQKDQPDNVSVLRAVATFYLRINRDTDAELILRPMAKGNGSSKDSTWARHQLALVLAHRSEYREALDLLGLAFDPQSGNIQEGRSSDTASAEEIRMRVRILKLLDSKSSRDRAITYLNEMNRRQALAPDDQFLLARLYEANGSLEKARDTIRGLASLFRSHPSYLAYYARCLLKHNDLDDADRFIDELEQQEKAHKVAAGSLGSTELRVQWLEQKGQGNKALTLLEMQAKAPGAAPPVILMWITSLARQNRWTEAEDAANRNWEACPAEAIGGISVSLIRDWGSMLYRASAANGRESVTRQREEALARLERRLRDSWQAEPKSAPIALQLADLLTLRSQFAEAEAIYRQIISQHPHNILALNNLAWLLALKPGNEEEGLDPINQAIDLAGPLSYLLDTRALVNLSLNRGEAAIADLEHALADSPSGFRYFHLARAYRLVGNAEAAAQAFGKAVENKLELEQLHPVERVVYREMVKDYELK